MSKKTHSSVPASSLIVAVLVSGIVNSAVTLLSLIILMPCMISDALGSMALITYLRKKSPHVKLPRANIVLLGAAGGFMGCMFFMGFLLLIFLVFGNLLGMTSSADLLINSITGSGTFPAWLAILIGFAVFFMKIIISAIVAVAAYELD